MSTATTSTSMSPKPPSPPPPMAPTTPIMTLPLNPYVYGNDCCQASHALKHQDTNNFGGLYKNSQLSTRSLTFLPLCKGCLLAKFGLLEDVVKTTNNLQCYYNRKTMNNTCDHEDGPFLRAFKTTGNVYKKTVAFENNTIILPAGQLLLDVFMMEASKLFLRDLNTVEVVINSKSYFMNNYLYLYFKMLHQMYAYNVNLTSPFVRNTDEFNDQQFSILHHMIKDGYSNISYKCEAFLLGNLINPTGGVSHYVKDGEMINYSQYDKKVHVTLVHKPQAKGEEPVLDDGSHYVITEITNPRSKIKGVQKQTLQNFNDHAYVNTNDFQTFIHNRKRSMEDYFVRGLGDNIQSAIGLHLAHMCIPSSIVDREEPPTSTSYKKLRTLKANVKYVEGVGLLSTRTICHGDFLIIDTATLIDNFMSIKGCNVGNSVSFNDPPKHFGKKESQQLRSGPILNSVYYAGM